MKRLATVALLLAIAALLWWLAPDPTAPAQKATAAAPDTTAPVATAQGATASAATPELSTPSTAPTRIPLLPSPAFGEEPYEFALELGHYAAGSTTVFLGLDGASLGCCWAHGERTTIRFRGKQPTLPIVLDTGLLRRIRLTTDAPLRTSIGNDQRLLGIADELIGEDPPAEFFAFPEGREAPPDLVTGYRASVGIGINTRFRGAIDITVVDAAGQPVTDAQVGLQPKRPAQRESSAGHTVFQHVANGTYKVTAIHPVHGRGSATVVVAGARQATTLQLSLAGCVCGHVVDPTGKPLARRRIVWAGDDGAWDNWKLTGDDGSFVLTDLASVSGTLWVCAAKDLAVPPALGMRADPTPGHDHVLTIDPAACHGSIAIEPVLPAAIPADQVAVRLWHRESGFGVHGARNDDGVFTATNLPAGFYTCEVIAPGIGVVPAATTWIDGRHAVHLGRFTPPMPGTLVLDVAPGTLPEAENRVFDLLHLLADANLHVATIAPLPVPALLPAGDYALAWRDRDGHTHWERFAMKNGTTTTVRLAR